MGSIFVKTLRRAQAIGKSLRTLVLLVAAGHLAAAGAVAPGHVEAGQPIAIGMTAPLSGPQAAYGKVMRDTIAAYFKQVNDQGGIGGRALQLETMDDAHDARRAVQNINSLITQKNVVALIGASSARATSEAMDKVFGPARVPLVGALSGSETLRGSTATNANRRYMFNVRASYLDETKRIAKQLSTLGMKEVGVFFQEDEVGPSEIQDTKTMLEKNGLTMVAKASVPRASLDVDDAVGLMSRGAPRAVIMAAGHKSAAAFVREMKKRSAATQFFALSLIDTERFVRELGTDARGVGITQVMPSPTNPRTKVARDYQRLVGRDADLSNDGIHAYVMASVLTQAIRNAGKDVSRGTLTRSLEALRDLDLGGLKIRYDALDHSGTNFVDMGVVGHRGQLMR